MVAVGNAVEGYVILLVLEQVEGEVVHITKSKDGLVAARAKYNRAAAEHRDIGG